MAQRTVTIVVPEGYENGEAFAKDCGFEIVEPKPLLWDAGSNRHYEPVEKLAQEIYESFAFDGPEDKPGWVPHGNSDMQEYARRKAREKLRVANHQPC